MGSGFRSPARALSALLLIAGCHGEAEQARRTEAGRISHAVDNLRNVSNDTKAPYLAALERMSCSAPDLCELKRACVDAYRHQIHALSATHAVRRELQGDSGPGVAPSAAASLVSAQQELEKAERQAHHCADLQGAVERRY